MSCSQTESRYSHLLQPIRDLAANWDVDIAAELEEYLEALENVSFSFDGSGETSLNFAEAALVIQGSACVYSKKVQYLHTLVYQVLDFLSQKQKKERKGPDKGEDDADEFDDEEKFLTLDDCLEEGTNIDLDDATSAPPPLPARRPALLMSLEDTISGPARGDGESISFQIARCGIHSSGALLLEPREGEFLNDCLERIESSRAQVPHQAQQAPEDAEEPLNDSGPPGIDPMETDCLAEGAKEGADGIQDADLESGAADDEGGFPDSGWDDFQGYPHPPEVAEGGSGRAPNGDDQPLPQQRNISTPAEEDPEEEFFDPWVPLDPNDPGSVPQKSFQKMGKPRPRKPRRARLKQSWLFDAIPPSAANPNDLTFREFAYALPSRHREQKPNRTGITARAEMRAASPPLQSAFTLVEAGRGGLPDEDPDDYPDPGGAPSDDEYDGDPLAPDGGVDPDLPDEAAMYAAATWAPGGDMLGDPGRPGEPGGPMVSSYEEQCRAHVEACIAAAAASEVRSALAVRVSAWQSRIVPLLEEQDGRPPFNIHESGRSILDRMSRLSLQENPEPAVAAEAQPLPLGPLLPFSAVVHESAQWEVSRLFSAMLQLVNNGNVEILRGEGSFQLRLLVATLPVQDFSQARGPLSALDINVGAVPAPAGKGKAKPSGASRGKAGPGTNAAKRRKAAAVQDHSD
eukprot:jgi/Botrbrau1/12180/Bobra.0186s0088.1